MHYYSNKGFTLVELIAVMVIIGIVAVIAVPRYLNLNDKAYSATRTSLASALAAASADNYAKRTTNSTLGIAVTNCSAIGSLLSSGLPTGYSIASTSITANSAASCTLTGPNGVTATFRGLGIT